MKTIVPVTALIFVIFLSYIGMTSKYRQPSAQAAALPITPVKVATTTPRPTNTLIPSSTIDYQKTAVIAQQTADEARRVNAVVTAQFEQRLQAQLQMTADYEKRNQQIYQWTAIAANTTIPLTATQQAILNTQIPQKNQIIAAQLTATQNAPTQIVAMAQAESMAKFANMDSIGRIFAEFSIGIFVLIFAARLFFHMWQERLAPMETESEVSTEPARETVIQVRTNKGTGGYSQARYVFPGTPAQLTELADAITQGTKSLAIGNWEKKGELGKPVILRIRAWLREPRETPFVNIAPDGQLIPTDGFLTFLCSWLDREALPAGYEFETTPLPPTEQLPIHTENMAKNVLTYENHTYESGGGGGLASPEALEGVVG